MQEKKVREKLRKKIVSPAIVDAVTAVNVIDIIQNAEVIATSESENFPLDNIVDGSTGPGSSQWVAAKSGTQTLIFKFDMPRHLRAIVYEIEEKDVARTQEVCFEVSSDSGASFSEILRQEYNFSPGGSTFQKEQLTVDLPGITAVKMTIKPDKGGGNALAKLNHLAFLAAD